MGQVPSTWTYNMQNSKWTLWNGIFWMPKNKGIRFHYFDSTSKQWNKSLKTLRKVRKKQTKNKEKGWRLHKWWKSQKDEKRTTIDDPFFFFFIFQPQVPYVLFFRSLAPRIVQRCQWNCGINLKPSDNENYLVVKSYGSTTYTVNGDFLVENENWSKLCAFR